MFNSIYIFGTGMMGGSLACSIKQAKVANKIYGFDREIKNLKYAKKNKIINDYDSKDFKLLSKADLIIICTPLSSYKKVFGIINKHKKDDAIVTDIGSAKSDIIKLSSKLLKNNNQCFIGSHPLAGKEKSTINNYDKDMYKNSIILLTPTSKTDKKLNTNVCEFWSSLKCQVLSIEPEVHDLVMSQTSHLPHLVSFALVNIILNSKSIKNIKAYTGGGFKDFARLAHSDSLMWKDICWSNKKNITKSIILLIKELQDIKKIINRNDSSLFKYLKDTKIKLNKK